MHSIIRDDHGRLVPVVRPKLWQAASVKRSRDRDRLHRARTEAAKSMVGDDAVDERAGSPGHCRAGGDRHPVVGGRTLARRAGPARGFHGEDVREAGLADAGGRSGATERNGSRPGASCTRRLIAAGIVD